MVYISNHDVFHIFELLFKFYKMNYGQSFIQWKFAFIKLSIPLVALLFSHAKIEKIFYTNNQDLLNHNERSIKENRNREYSKTWGENEEIFKR